MKATLYTPPTQHQQVSIAEDWNELIADGFCRLPVTAPELLGCEAGLVDMLATGPEYVAFAIFDYEGGNPNVAAMEEMERLTGHSFGEDADSTLLGPVLIIRNDN